MPRCSDAHNRSSLSESAYLVARAYAAERRISLGKAVSELILNPQTSEKPLVIRERASKYPSVHVDQPLTVDELKNCLTMSEPVYLHDSSALIALLTDSHVHRDRVIEWLESPPKVFALCSLTQGAFLRSFLRAQAGASLAQGQRALRDLSLLENYRFVADDQNYADLDPRGIRGHRQVTDAYLVHLADSKRLKLATLDHALASLYPATSVKIPV